MQTIDTPAPGAPEPVPPGPEDAPETGAETENWADTGAAPDPA